MAETLVEQRIISGTGVLRATFGISPVRYYSLLFDVIRLPKNIDRSLKYNPFRQRFAQLVFLRDGYVVAEGALDYTKRRLDYIVDTTGQALVSLKCAHAQVLGELGVVDPEQNSSIREHANLNLMWNELRVSCFQDTGIQVRLMQQLLDECGQEYYEKEPPPPPPPLPEVPPGTPIGDISPPYEGDDVTSPYQGDEFEQPPPPEPEGTLCANYTLTVGYRFAFAPFATGTFSASIRAPYLSGSLRIGGAWRNEVYFVHAGFTSNIPAQCALNMQEREIRSVSSGAPPRNIYDEVWVVSIV